MRDVFSECFGWSNWPGDLMLNEGAIPPIEPEPETNQLTLSNRRQLFRYGSSRRSLIETAHQPFSIEIGNLMAGLLCDNIRQHDRRIPFPRMIHESLDVETVFLKKEKNNLALHMWERVRPSLVNGSTTLAKKL